jgi:hypothetical protein
MIRGMADDRARRSGAMAIAVAANRNRLEIR